jgi:hypothetical protein
MSVNDFPRIVNLTGGILAWSDGIDPKVQKWLGTTECRFSLTNYPRSGINNDKRTCSG